MASSVTKSVKKGLNRSPKTGLKGRGKAGPKDRRKAAPTRARLLKFQRQIFHSLTREATTLLGETPSTIRQYKAEFERDFKGKALSNPSSAASRSNKNELVREIRRATVTFIADYHTFHQAQRTALRLLREVCRPGENWAVGLELVPSRYQPALDAFQNGELSLEEFHRHIHYKAEWGFPWRNYEPLFHWARENKIRLIALNLPKEFASLRHQRDLHQRDRWAAGLITDLLSLNSDLKMVVLYGELHVASSHLPKQFARVSKDYFRDSKESVRGKKPAARTVIVHQNHDGLYWKLAAKGREVEANVVKLGAGKYCVFSSTPWNKLQSLVSWAESDGGESGWSSDDGRGEDGGRRGGEDGKRASEGRGRGSDGSKRGSSAAKRAGDGRDDSYDPESDDDEGVETDYVSVLQTYGKAVSELMGVETPSFETITARTIDQSSFLDQLSETLGSAAERRLIQGQISRGHRLYIPGAKLAYLGSPSPNGAAELAAAHVMNHYARSHSLQIHSRPDFSRWMLENAFSFFGSLVINPRRKCDLAEDHRRAIRAALRVIDKSSDKTKKVSDKGKGAPGKANSGKAASGKTARVAAEDLRARKLALAILRADRATIRRSEIRIPLLERELEGRDSLSQPVLLAAAQYVGRILGKRMHQALLEGRASADDLRHLFLTPTPKWEARYVALLESLGRSKVEPSKSDTL